MQVTEITNTNLALPYNKKKYKNIHKTTPNPQKKSNGGGGEFLENICKAILQKYERQDLADLARSALANRQDITAPTQFIEKVIQNHLKKEASDSQKGAQATKIQESIVEAALADSERSKLNFDAWQNLPTQQKQFFRDSIPKDHFLAEFKNNDELMAAEWSRQSEYG